MTTKIELQFYPANADDYESHRPGFAESLRSLAKTRARAAMMYLKEDEASDSQPAISLMADVEVLLEGAALVEEEASVEIGLTAEHVDLDRLQTQAVVLMVAVEAFAKRYSIDQYEAGPIIELASGLFGGIGALASRAKVTA